VNKAQANQTKSDAFRVLYVHFNSELSGSDISLLNLVRTLDQDRFTPYVLLPFDGPLVKELEDAGAHVSFIPQPKIRRNLWSVLKYSWCFLPTIVHVRKHIIEEEIDIVHTNPFLNLYGPIAAKLARRPHIHHIRQYDLKPRIILYAVAMLVRSLSAFVVPVSYAVKDRLYGAESDPKVQVVYNGIDVSRFRHGSMDRTSIRRKLGIPNDAMVVGCISNLWFRKGQDVLVRALVRLWPRFPNLYCLLVGRVSPEFRQFLRDIAGEVGAENHLVFTGVCGHQDIPKHISAMDVSVHPSLVEAFPRAVLEVMSCGKPIVASRVGGIPEAIEDGRSGLLVTPGSVDELAVALETLLVDVEYSTRLGAEAAGRVEKRFGILECTRAVESLYLRCVA